MWTGPGQVIRNRSPAAASPPGWGFCGVVLPLGCVLRGWAWAGRLVGCVGVQGGRHR